MALRDWLISQDGVSWVRHPEMRDDSHIKRNVSFGCWLYALFRSCWWQRKGGAAFINSLSLATHLANVGDSRTLVLHPGVATHSFVTY